MAAAGVAGADLPLGGRLAEARAHRGANGQPTGISPRFGGVPGMAESGSPLRLFTGSEANRLRVYGFCGCANSSRVGPSSMI